MTEDTIVVSTGMEEGSISLEGAATLSGMDGMCRRGINFCLELPTIRIEKGDLFAIELLIREALANAVFHGSQADPLCRIIMRLKVDNEGVTIEVSDEGPGFDWRDSLERPVGPEGESGRGLPIYRYYADTVSFNEAGNAVTLKRNWRREKRDA